MNITVEKEKIAIKDIICPDCHHLLTVIFNKDDLKWIYENPNLLGESEVKK